MRTTLKIILPSTGDVVPRSNLNPVKRVYASYANSVSPDRRGRWLVNRFIPMQRSIKSILNGVVVIAEVLWLLNTLGLFHSLAHIHVGT